MHKNTHTQTHTQTNNTYTLVVPTIPTPGRQQTKRLSTHVERPRIGWLRVGLESDVELKHGPDRQQTEEKMRLLAMAMYQ